MPRRLKQQRRGKGKPRYRSPTHQWKFAFNYPSGSGDAKIVDLVHAVGRNAPAMKMEMDGEEFHLPAPEGVRVGEIIQIGREVVNRGNIMFLNDIPEGTRIFNIELRPGDGGKLVRTSGASARVVAREDGRILIQMPSKKMKKMHPQCRATVGIIAGGGRKEKPMLKAGKKYHSLKSGSKVWPKVAGVAMNPVDHPFGGGGRASRKHKTVSRGRPPGRKVGSIAARKTGIKKIKRKFEVK
jgi:large subunit ribosomal protein L2